MLIWGNIFTIWAMGLWRPQTEEARPVWSVTELTAYIRELLEIDYRLQDIHLEGELSNVTKARSGHLYFTLKDAGAQLKCVMWKGQVERLRFHPAEGDAVQLRGRLTVYEASGQYQLVAEQMTPAGGRGGLAEAFEQLKQKLESQGLFDPAHKKPIPKLPRKIGIVTSLDAAALRDILNVLRRRFPAVQVLIAPTLVQGEQAPAQIVRALRWLDGRDDIDTIIVARGGGSIEDLWAFNDEEVARAIFSAQHPIISGVGHEVDFTIADFVADLRAPTPSAAAELATPDGQALQAAVADIGAYLHELVLRHLEKYQQKVATLQRSLRYLGPRQKLESNQQRLDHLTGRLERAMGQQLERREAKIALLTAKLASLNPRNLLQRGYVIVRTADGRVATSSGELHPQDLIFIDWQDGRVEAIVQKIEKRES